MTYAVILAGGWGERLWPMSTRARPKQLLSLMGESTLVGSTLARMATLVSLPDTLVMTSEALKERMVEELASVPAHRVIGEPEGKNTAPAIALAAKLLVADDPDAIMVVLPADHVIADDDGFRAAARDALAAAGFDDQRTAAWCDDRVHYEPLGRDGYDSLAERIRSLEEHHGLPGNRVFYLALPPRVFPTAITSLGEAGLSHSKGWTRLVIEKPFGRDLSSAHGEHVAVVRDDYLPTGHAGHRTEGQLDPVAGLSARDAGLVPDLRAAD